MIEDFKQQIIAAHASTNHFYDEDLPYSFHLKATEREVISYKSSVYPIDLFSNKDLQISMVLRCAAWAHDCIEDARVSYNDLVKMLKNTMSNFLPQEELIKVAEVVRAVTNYSRGRDRHERMPDWIYKDIRNTEHADFIKLCDRLANVRYSIFTRSNMAMKYKTENANFISKITNRPEVLAPMINDLNRLFEHV